LRLLLCASTATLILGAAPGGEFVAPAQAQVEATISAPMAPPLLPVYAQPPIPGPGYLWVPGYWGWDGTEYYWVPGYWEQPPSIGLYWTPGYWTWDNTDNDYVYYAGYWASTVGYYGGIDYGFGYTGEGYHGGYWRNDTFYYNRAVNNVGTTHVAGFFNQVPPPASHVSFNGGNGGTTVRPTPAEMAAARAHRIGPTPEQVQHQEAASRMPSLKFKANHGHPAVAAMERPNAFNGTHASGAAATGAAAARFAEHVPMPPAAPERRATEPAHAGPQVHGPAEARHLADHTSAPNFAKRGPTMHGPAMANFAHRAPMMRGPAAARTFVSRAPMMHAPAMQQHFAYHAPAMHRGGPAFAPARIGAMNIGGMHFGAGPRMAGGMHIGGGPHVGGGSGATGGHRPP
jgi:hypothetical protein